MRRPENLKVCEVRGCQRYAGKDLPGFCRRCWALVDQEERAGMLFAVHAPFWPRTIRYEKGDEIESGGARYGMWADKHSRYYLVAELPDGEAVAGLALREYERRTTLEALLRKIGARREAVLFGAAEPDEDEVEERA